MILEFVYKRKSLIVNEKLTVDFFSLQFVQLSRHNICSKRMQLRFDWILTTDKLKSMYL